MNTFFPCPRCKSEKIIPDARVLDRDGQYADGNLSVQVCGNPDAWIFKDAHQVELRATICCQCGYTELTSQGDLEKLWQLFSAQKR